MTQLITPYGGSLIDLTPGPKRLETLKESSASFPSLDLDPFQLGDLELLGNGGYSPLVSYLGRKDYESVLAEMRLADGTFWPLPIMLDADEKSAEGLTVGQTVALRDPEGFMVAALTLEEIWRPDRAAEAKALFGTDDPGHPGAGRLLEKRGTHYLTGKLEVLERPVHHSHLPHRRSPAEVRGRLGRLGWTRVLGLSPRTLLHRAELEAALAASRESGANLLVQPMEWDPDPHAMDPFVRMQALRAALETQPADAALLNLLPNAPRAAGVRDLLAATLIHRNFGCDRTLAPPDDKALTELRRWEKETGVAPIPHNAFPPDEETPTLADEEVRNRLEKGRPFPDGFTLPAVEAILRHAFPPRSKQGFTVFFTGLSGSGKSTIAGVLLAKLKELNGRPITLLDGDIVRKNLSSELGFSRKDRSINVRRIGFVASEITKNGGIAICAPIAPYRADRRYNRDLIAPLGGYLEVHVATSLETCEARDRKGLYAKARAGIIPEFTGISDPYEEPEHPEVTLTEAFSPEEAAREVLQVLRQKGYLT